MHISTPGLIIAAPASGSGKTLITLGLLRALARNGVAIGSAKVGPDYIDPAFHAAATGRACFNIDLWAMRDETIHRSLRQITHKSSLVIAEGVMGLFDGAADGYGSTADLAAITGWPVVLVVDSRSQGASAAALVRGFITHRADISVSGVIFNKIGSNKHRDIIDDAMKRFLPKVRVLGYIPRSSDLEVPSRHLGLVQAHEKTQLDSFIDRAADLVEQHVDCEDLRTLARRLDHKITSYLQNTPLGQRIAVADDVAFGFSYPHLLAGWQEAGAEIMRFSPLAGEAPAEQADSIYLPGGYPELHAGKITANTAFLSGLKDAAERSKPIFGECGGYMVLGEGMIDAQGHRHAMAGLLPVETSFAQRKLHLGYRLAEMAVDSPIGNKGEKIKGHEFHFATTVSENASSPLFLSWDASGESLGATGICIGTVAGSFLHVIDRASP